MSIYSNQLNQLLDIVFEEIDDIVVVVFHVSAIFGLGNSAVGWLVKVEDVFVKSVF